MRRSITFRCSIKKGIGKHSDLKIPGRLECAAAPSDWPIHLEPGSLNALIRADGYPDSFDSFGSAPGMKRLDEGLFVPEFVIPKTEIKNNTKGDAQVWRARISVPGTGDDVDCWALRRIGSGIARQVELVSEVHMRTEFHLEDGSEVVVTLFEGAAVGRTGEVQP